MLSDLAPPTEQSHAPVGLQLPPWRSVVVALLLGVAGMMVVSMIWEPLAAPWEFDESYNLQVVENLRDGNGYATNGAVRGDGPWKFDPNISTGPAVLGPVWVLSLPLGTLAAARVTMFGFLATLLCLVRVLTGPGRRGWFVFALTLLAGLPFVEAANPLLVLGEIPATAYLLGALVAMRRHSYWLMGLLIGLTSLAKLNYATPALAIVAVWIGSTLLTEPGSWRTLTRKVGQVAAAALAPVLAFEAYRLLSLRSVSEYRVSLAELRSFLEVQRLDNWTQAPELLGDKIVALVDMPGPALLMALALCAFSAPFLGRVPVRPDAEWISGDDLASARTETALAAAGVSIIGTWLFLSAFGWLRQGAPGAALLATGLILVFTRRAMPALHHPERWARVSVATVLALVAGLLCLTGMQQTIRMARDITGTALGPTQREQRDVADLIENSGATGMLGDGWFQNPQLQLLSGVPAASMPGADERPLLVIGWEKFLFSDDPDGLAGELDKCDSVLYRSDHYLACWPLEGDDVDD